MTEFKPKSYIGEKIGVEFDKEPLFSKSPPLPDRIIWQGKTIVIEKKLGEWQDFNRSGSMAHNMRPANMAKALRRGSWGVGRFYFRVRAADGRIFELYYDRAPRDAGDRLGSWYLDRELVDEDRGSETGDGG